MQTIKRWVTAGVAALGISSVALAADPLDPGRVRFGIDFGISQGVGAGINAAGSLNNLTFLAPGVGLGARADLSVSFASPTIGVLSVAPVVSFPFDNGGFFVGPSLAVGFGGTSASVGFGLKAGAEVGLANDLMLYGSADITLPTFTGNFVAGVDFEVSEPISAFGEVRLRSAGGNVGFGVGAGLAYRFAGL